MHANDPLVEAVTFGAADEVRTLLAAKPDAASRAPYSDEVSSLLHEAAVAGHATVVDLLLQAGAPTATLDEDGQTALHHASCEGHIEVVRRLAPAADCPELYVTDAFQMTAYHLACENGHTECVHHLLELLEEPPADLEPRASQLRRGSAVFLAEQAGHTGVLEIINSDRGSRPASARTPSSRGSSAAPSIVSLGTATAMAAAAVVVAAEGGSGGGGGDG